ncbi:4-aminobutyrate aminotransferase/(S)-3-amino-2-methylpropionate transaminase [Bacillus thermophilus]|uniref:(S)-3-amino-2-methylpropionate transaminase n=1 Tax=Siminovitchia thermophila TaxID=1245522 RepID=A0ABS2R779_9BACI|nr:4-aminobutyrate--2-oxoglutarate transaminase [Siminovitchia thermophila]MBM7715009.1 4-aminobutyrate aminotransferase/(S)-3-amino-2-methylpropionate transaminase [Siminovitchia thermophila]ONK22374.1 4-aminobutyrate--2-oxoglutarate transaminase [Bacillus sp. VT-16-64]
MGFIEIKTTIPGPRSLDLWKKRKDAVPNGISTNIPIGVSEASGALIRDMDGNCFIDLAGGIGTLNVGHLPPGIVEVLKEQLDCFIHPVFSVTMYESYIQLAEKLNRLVPGTFPKKTIFLNSGAEGVENAIKIARRFTGRPGIISFERSFHGRTFMTMSLTGKVKDFKQGFGPMATDVYKVPYPYPYRDEQTTDEELLNSFHRLFQTTVDPRDVAAIMMEPVQGEGGLVVPSATFVKGVRKLCDQFGIVFIADEVQTGFARTGKLFAMEHFDVEADITVLSKSIAAGIPLAAVTGKADIMDSPKQKELGTTLGGSPLGCIAGLKVLEMIEKENLTDRANLIGQQIKKRLAHSSSFIGEIRGIGAMIGIEIVKDQDTMEPYPEMVKDIVKKCYENGVIILTAGAYGNVIRLLPPLVITDAELSEALAVLESVLSGLEKEGNC